MSSNLTGCLFLLKKTSIDQCFGDCCLENSSRASKPLGLKEFNRTERGSDGAHGLKLTRGFFFA